MKCIIAFALAAAIVIPTIAEAGTSCSSRKSGSTTITTCSNTYKAGGFSQCRSYRSGGTVKTTCR